MRVDAVGSAVTMPAGLELQFEQVRQRRAAAQFSVLEGNPSTGAFRAAEGSVMRESVDWSRSTARTQPTGGPYLSSRSPAAATATGVEAGGGFDFLAVSLNYFLTGGDTAGLPAGATADLDPAAMMQFLLVALSYTGQGTGGTNAGPYDLAAPILAAVVPGGWVDFRA